MKCRMDYQLFRFSLFYCFCVVFFAGCTTTRSEHPSVGKSSSSEGQQDEISALQSVAGAISGKPVTQEEMKNLAQDLRKDKNAQSAVRAITDSMNPSKNVVKYCPVDGARFSAKFTTCPIHGVVLKEVE